MKHIYQIPRDMKNKEMNIEIKKKWAIPKLEILDGRNTFQEKGDFDNDEDPWTGTEDGALS